MKEYRELIEKISRAYYIEKSNSETESEWKARVVYSVAGETALASLWDKEEDDIPISIVYFKRRIEKAFNAYFDLFPSVRELYSADIYNLLDEIYTLYADTGYIYHSPNRISPVTESNADLFGVRYTRGLSIDQKRNVSGLGEYFDIDSDGYEEQILEMFHVDGEPLGKLWERLTKRKDWSNINVSGRVEYLRTTPQFTRGYWVDKPDKGLDISLLRMGEPGGWIYFLYKANDENLVGSRIPDWMAEASNYRKISNAILLSRGVLPEIKVKRNENTVNIRFNYLPARDIHNLIKLYSWPENYKEERSDFNRIMSKKVWESLRNVLGYLGYPVEE